MKITDIVNEVVDRYTKTVWVTPYQPRVYIPAENISLLKQELCDKLMLTKENRKGR